MLRRGTVLVTSTGTGTVPVAQRDQADNVHVYIYIYSLALPVLCAPAVNGNSMKDADDVLREYQRRAAKPRASGAGRRLQDNGPRTSAATDEIDASVAWMEARVKQLDVLASQPPEPKKAVATRTPRADGVAELSALELALRGLTSQLQSERARVAALRESLAAAGVDDSRVAQPAPPPTVAPSAAVAVRPVARGGRGVAAAPTTGADLKDAMARRAALVRRQTPVAQQQLAAVEQERKALEELAEATGVCTVDNETVEYLADPNGAADLPARLLSQIRRLDQAMRDGQRDASKPAVVSRSGIHSLADTAPSIPFTVFADGFMLYRGPFRPFDGDEARDFTAQVMAGYLPHELQLRHPDGLVFEIHDLTAETHAAAHARAAASTGSSAGRPHIGSLTDVQGAASLLAPQRPEQLLRLLPETIVRSGGDMVPVRSEIAAMLGTRPVKPGGRGASETDRQDGTDVHAMREARLRRFGA